MPSRSPLIYRSCTGISATKWISQATLESVRVHEMSVDNLTASTQRATETTAVMISKVDDLCHDVAGIESLAAQIQSIRASLDWLESCVNNPDMPLPSSTAASASNSYSSYFPNAFGVGSSRGEKPRIAIQGLVQKKK
ncbi:hypothetical protein BJ742DRAFT_375153 [Cladochytrium replicatum]|nr:hypothetical protein BJ742DRAFT_375153 [Cladochytrium replicatum]